MRLLRSGRLPGAASPPGASVSRSGPGAAGDDERGQQHTVPGDTLDDQRDAQPGSSGLPVVDSTPRRGPSGRAGHLHGLSRPPRRERRALRRQKRRERSTVVGRHPKTTILLLVLVALTPVWVSAGTAATDPALGPTVGGRLTEWVRDHGGGGIVTWAEDTWYTWHAPPKGGKPAAGAIPVVAPTTTTLAPVPTGPAHLPAPAAIVPFVADPSPGEGQWHAIGRTIDGVPTMYAAFLRPNDVYTSLVTGVAWMDTKLLSANLYAGSAIPGTGQAFPTMAPITGAALTTLDAAFNSGFRMQDADGGFYLDGIAADPLRTGAASLVIDSAGDVDIGAWGSDVTMTPTTVAVRQNLDLIVDDGAPAPGLDVSDSAEWGATLGGAIHVWRSGLGVTADGAVGLRGRQRPVHRRPGQRAGPGRRGAGHGVGHQHRLGQLHPLRPQPGSGGDGVERDAADLRRADLSGPLLRRAVAGLRDDVGALLQRSRRAVAL